MTRNGPSGGKSGSVPTDPSEFYTLFAGVYDRLARAPGVGRLRERVVAALDPPRGGTVVEFGCGTGANHPAVRERIGPAGTYVGVDLAPGVLRIARRREGGPRTAFLRGDATRLPLRTAAASETGGVGSASSGVSESSDTTGDSSEGVPGSPDGVLDSPDAAVASPDAALATFLVGMVSDPAAAVDRWATVVGSGGRLALCNFRRTTTPLARPANWPFRLFVRLGSPPAGSGRDESGEWGGSPVERLDRRVTTAHERLRRVCTGESFTRWTALGGLLVVSAGTVA